VVAAGRHHARSLSAKYFAGRAQKARTTALRTLRTLAGGRRGDEE